MLKLKSSVLVAALFATTAVSVSDANAGRRRHDVDDHPSALTEEEMRIFRKKASYELGRKLNDYYFLGEADPGTPPPGRTGCVLDQTVEDSDEAGLFHEGWYCDPL